MPEEALTVISDQRVAEAWRSRLWPRAHWIEVPPGETSKSIERLAEVWSGLVQAGCHRRSPLVAVGGGVITDLAGFAAATYLRGVPLYSLPCSLLAMVDASVGGKVGIDLPEGKNLAGAFYPARIVALDPELLSTLALEQWAEGMAEAIKHGVLAGGDLWSRLQDPGLRPPPAGESLTKEALELLARVVEVKLEVVAQDPVETEGVRELLNLGHTFGHALEWCTAYGLSHGRAVALGLLASVRLARGLGLLRVDFEGELTALLRSAGLPTQLPAEHARQCSLERLSAALDRDKKARPGHWRFIVPRAPGQVEAMALQGPDQLGAVREAFASLIMPAPGGTLR